MPAARLVTQLDADHESLSNPHTSSENTRTNCRRNPVARTKRCVRQCSPTRRKLMLNRFALIICMFTLATSTFAQSKPAGKMAAGAPDKAYLQKIWDGWSTLDPANTAQYYAKGEHTFFDIAPLKYSSWDEYEAGVKKVLADYQAGKFTVNDDAELHPAGDYVWGSATVKSDMTQK